MSRYDILLNKEDATPPPQAKPEPLVSEQPELPPTPPPQTPSSDEQQSTDQQTQQIRARTQAPTRARVNARRHASTTQAAPAAVVEELRTKLETKQRLSSYTFRFEPEDLERLDRLFSKLQEIYGRRLSKNDLPRVGLAWLLLDYDRNGDESMLAQVLKRI